MVMLQICHLKNPFEDGLKMLIVFWFEGLQIEKLLES